jgi:hypothetical protein
MKLKITDASFIKYKDNIKHFLCTTRFNNETWQENVCFRQNHPDIVSIYSTEILITSSVELNSILFVLEMNNDTNKIMGIGMLRNVPFYNIHNVHSNEKYNRFSYLGKHRIDRNDMDEEEEDIMKVFDILCFKGSDHLKRLKGIKLFPVYKLYKCSHIKDLIQFVSTMFKKRLQKPMLLKTTVV